MTSERDIERVLDHWFTERPTQVADRVLDEVADRIARQPQQPAWRVPRRDSHMNINLKALLAVAAVIVVAVAGFAVLRPSSSGIGVPAATEAPTVTASSTASTSAIDCQRSSGAFLRHRRMIQSISARPGSSPANGGGSAVRIAATRSAGVGPSNARRPAAISYNSAPKAKISPR